MPGSHSGYCTGLLTITFKKILGVQKTSRMSKHPGPFGLPSSNLGPGVEHIHKLETM